ncbi:MAG: endonuclease [Thermoproteus sp. JCHS_4]|jgi:Predicted nuclease of the RecB family|nr:MAG: endonuclease [Thermoproteus sp. JCHS_4]
MRILEPEPREAAAFINTNRRRGLIAVFCICGGTYRGRAAAELPTAPYLVVIKPDGTLLVHGSEKATPLVWNPPGSSNMAVLEGGTLLLKSLRPRPSESVVLKMERVLEIALFDAGSSSVRLRGTERDLVDFLVKNMEVVEPGLDVVGVEVPTEAGHIDILAVDGAGEYVVVEVKRDVADHEAVFQLRRYVEAVAKARGRARGVLVASDITSSAFHYLREYNLKFVKVKPGELVEKLLNKSNCESSSTDVQR